MASIQFVDEWQPDRWCGAMLKICDQHIVPGADEDFRYPEQWMYLVWRPVQRFIPFNRPDGWGLTIGHPNNVLCNELPDDVTMIYLLAEHECVWSSWLRIPLICDRFEPWLVAKINQRIEEQTIDEASRYAHWYGNHDADFQRFLNRMNGL